jgi:hypothetical protein
MESEFATVTSSVPSVAKETIQVVERDWVKIALVIAVLALLGINVFAYFSQIAEWFGKTFGPLFRGTVGTAANVVGDTAKQTIQTAAEGTQAVIGGVAKGAESGISELQGVLDGQIRRNNIDGRGLDLSLQQVDSQFVIDQDNETADVDFLGKKTKGHGNAGYCYIGEDRGVRSCMYVGNGDMCGSGMIYPTMDVCVNPNLRA